MNKRILPWMFTILVLTGLSCQPTTSPRPPETVPPPTESPLPTVPPSPTATITPTPIPTATPLQLSVFPLPDLLVESLSIWIPAEVASGGIADYVGRGEEHDDVGQILPQHSLITLQGYPVPIGSKEEPALRLFTVNGMMERFDEQVTAVRALLAGQPIDLARIPAFPNLNPSMLQKRLVNPLDFQNGSGFRYINFDAVKRGTTITDMSVSYIYQGLTTDGRYYVSIILPIDQPSLHQQAFVLMTREAASPSAASDLMLLQLIPQLDAAADDDFIPSLTILDSMIQTLLITPE